MILALAVSAALAGVDAVIVDGPLVPGRAATLEVASTDGVVPPAVQLTGATVQGPVPERPRVWRWRVVPSTDADAVRVSVGEARWTFPVAPPGSSPLEVPAVLDASTTDRRIRIPIRGAELPTIDAIEVLVADGEVVDLGEADGELWVDVALGDNPFPRFVPVGVRDLRSDARPAWTLLKLRARPRLPLEAEPGATLHLQVGGRRYGPFVADAQGRIEARVDQYPGEGVASAVLTDDLGNETRTDLPLGTSMAPALAVFPTDAQVPGRPPPLMYLFGRDPDGAVPAGRPTCRTPALDLRVIELEPGSWMVALPATEPLEDLRVACSLGATTVSRRIPVAAGVADHLGMRVWPEDLRADFPEAEVRVVLEDARGERLPVSGVEVAADLGEVALDEDGGMVARGDYTGGAAIAAGEDRIVATYVPPRGEGAVREVELRWGPVPSSGGTLSVHARALDALRRPLIDVPMVLEIAGERMERSTGSDGWATAERFVSASFEPLTLQAQAGARQARALVLPGEGARGGPGTPDLVEARSVRISPGRVVGISVEVQPAVLRAAPGAVAWVYVTLEDRAGQAVVDEPVRLEATEGTIGEVHARGDGTLVAEYTPLPSEQRREVEITAETQTIRSSAHLALEPRIVRWSFGPWVGMQTNFGELASPTLGVDLDVRTRARWFGESLMVRVGAQGVTFRSLAATGVGPEAELRSSVVPITGALLFRDDRGPWSLWGGGGGALAVHRLQVRFDDELAAIGNRSLVGPVLIGAIARRALGGELVLTGRGLWLPAANDEVGYSGNLGGVSLGLGYRLVY